MNEYLNRNFFGNTMESWAIALLVFLASLLAIYFFKKIIIRHLKKLSQKTVTTIDDFIVAQLKVL